MRFSNAIKNGVFRLLTETIPTRSIFDACARAEPGNARGAGSPDERELDPGVIFNQILLRDIRATSFLNSARGLWL